MDRPTPTIRFAVVLAALPLSFLAPGAARAADIPAPAGEKLQADGLALLRAWTPPVYPAEALKKKTSGMVTVRFIVDDTGKVTQARALEDSDEGFVEAALAAVRSWGFVPALDAGKPVACCLDTLVTFSPAVGQQKKSAIPPEDQRMSVPPRTAPQGQVTPPGDYPSVLVDRKIPGTVRFGCTVTTDGHAVAPVIRGASHVDFVLPALHALSLWEFKPGMQGDLVVQSVVEGVVTFDSIIGNPGEVLAANDITAPDGTPPPVSPEPSFVADPVWPLGLLLKGDGGSATVEFTVNESGAVRDVRVREATQPEFGRALAAAVETWGFGRPVENNHVVSVALIKRAEFKAIPLDATDETDPLARLVLALRRGEIGTAKGLDEKLTPIYRVRPDYPVALKAADAPKGHTDIELVIDRDGRARLPRIVSATQEEFGWAAATAVAQWIFKAPRRGGEPVAVKVRIPFEFAAPES